jgi:hypothetical protein
VGSGRQGKVRRRLRRGLVVRRVSRSGRRDRLGRGGAWLSGVVRQSGLNWVRHGGVRSAVGPARQARLGSAGCCSVILAVARLGSLWQARQLGAWCGLVGLEVSVRQGSVRQARRGEARRTWLSALWLVAAGMIRSGSVLHGGAW